MLNEMIKLHQRLVARDGIMKRLKHTEMVAEALFDQRQHVVGNR